MKEIRMSNRERASGHETYDAAAISSITVIGEEPTRKDAIRSDEETTRNREARTPDSAETHWGRVGISYDPLRWGWIGPR